MNVLKGHGNNPINSLEFARVAKKAEKTATAAAANPGIVATAKGRDKDFSKKFSYPAETKASELYSPVDAQQLTQPKDKWKTIEEIREEAKRNVELRRK